LGSISLPYSLAANYGERRGEKEGGNGREGSKSSEAREKVIRRKATKEKDSGDGKVKGSGRELAFHQPNS